MFKTAQDYANQLNSCFLDRGVPLSEVFNAARQFPHVPAQFWVDVTIQLRRWDRLIETETQHPEVSESANFND